MRKLKIATAPSRNSRNWKNKEYDYSVLVGWLAQPTKYKENMAEFKALSKDAVDKLKDGRGGYLCGELAGGRRLRSNVNSRSVLTFDIDNANAETIPKIETAAVEHDFAYIIHSTAKSTKQSPRLRFLVPLGRDVSGEEYVAVARKLAYEIGIIDDLDASTYDIHRLMYYPSCPSDADYIFRTGGNKELDPDKWLAKYTDWRDITLYPTGENERSVKEPYSGHKKTEPTAVKGVVGAFCRAFTMQAAIEQFLGDVYESTEDINRYHLKGADSIAGLIVYEDKFCYSWHAKDKACTGKEYNAFELVCLHNFKSDEDEKKAYNAMREWAVELVEVKRELDNAKREKLAKVEWGTLPSEQDENTEPEEWKNLLEYDRKGCVVNSRANMELVLTNDTKLQKIAFNCLSERIELCGDVPWRKVGDNVEWGNTDDNELILYVDKLYGLVSKTICLDILDCVSAKRAFHPVLDYFKSLPKWDGTARAERVFIDTLGAEDTEYNRAISLKVLCAAVRRVKHPGTKFDTILVLKGEQGIGKSTLAKKLGMEWFTDSLSMHDIQHGKDAPEKICGKWIIEIGEMAGFKKAEMERVRGFLSTTEDRYRASYARRVETHRRVCVFIGTINASRGFLTDEEGNRRYWIMDCKNAKNDSEKVFSISQDYVDQLWAEVLIKESAGESLILTTELEAVAEQLQRENIVYDDRQVIIEKYLDTPLPHNWEQMNLFDRRRYLKGEETLLSGSENAEKTPRNTISILEIWEECFGKNSVDITHSDSLKIGRVLQRIFNWEKYETRENNRKVVKYRRKRK